MRPSEILSNAAKAEADRRRRLASETRSAEDEAKRKKLWEALNKVCEFVPHGTAYLAARTWTSLFMDASYQLKIAGEVGRLEAMRYKGPDQVRIQGMESAFETCRLACAGHENEVKTGLEKLIQSTSELQSAFRLYLECVRDNRRWWGPADGHNH